MVLVVTSHYYLEGGTTQDILCIYSFVKLASYDAGDAQVLQNTGVVSALIQAPHEQWRTAESREM